MTSYRERRHFAYTPDQLFDLVADVEAYPEFVPGVIAARILRRDGDRLSVEMTVGNRLMRRRFASTAVLQRPHRIEIGSQDPLFESLTQIWTFEPAEPSGTNLTYRLDFEMRSRLLQVVIGQVVMGAVFGASAGDIVRAFRRRARQIYGAS